jgi:hypothetical protein
MKILPLPLNSRITASALVTCLSCLFAAVGHAQPEQTPARDWLPLVSFVSEIMFLDQANEAASRARQFESRNALIEAAREYERLINDSAALSPELKHSYEFYMVLAGAHLDAARVRMNYDAALGTSLDLTEENRARIGAHLREVPGLVAAANKLVSGSDVERFRCEARKLLANGQCFLGILNRYSPDLLAAIRTYGEVEKCDPKSAAQAREMVSYAKSVEADISKRLFRTDNIAKALSKVVSLSVPRVGGYLSGTMDLLYEFYKEKHGKTMPAGPR